MKHWTISQKLIGLMLVVGVGSIAVTGWISVTSGASALLAQQIHALEAIRTSRQNSIEAYFKTIHEQIFNFAQNDMIFDAMREFAAAFKSIAAQMKQPTEPGSDLYNTVEGYYSEEFRPRLEQNGRPWKGVTYYMPKARSARLLQAVYIAENPYVVGEKHELENRPYEGDYHRVHAKYHPRIRDFLESFGYYDIFLFDLEGNLVYSVFKETDYATNFLTGPYKDTNLAEVYRRARKGWFSQLIAIEDFGAYDPSYGRPASFIGAPVLHDDEKVGVAAFQMPVDRINAIMGDTAGLGETGASFLIGSDHLMRSDARFGDQSTIFRQQVDTRAANLALEGQSGTVRQSDYRGVDALTSYGPMSIDGLDWAILTEIAMAEITEPADRLRNRIFAFGVGLSVLVIFLSYYFLRRTVITPIHKLAEGAHRIEQGDYTAHVDVGSSDELGKLGDAFNEMGSAIAEDIQKRKQAEELLRESEIRYRFVSERPGQIMYDCDLQTGEFKWSGDIEGVTGHSLSDFPVMDYEAWQDRVHPEDREAALAAFETAIEQKTTCYTEYRFRREDGVYFYAEDNGLFTFDDEGKPYHMLGLIKDVTERKQAEEAIRESERLLTTVMNNMPAVVFLRDRNGRFNLVNRMYAETYGASEDFIRGKTLHEVLPKDQADEYAAQDREVIHQKEAIETELTIKRNGRAQIFAAVRFPVMDTAGEVFAVGGIELDITERKRAEEELLRAQAAAETANVAKSEFLSNMSHELRTPLNGVLGYAQILQRDKSLSEQHRESLDAIESCGQHLLTLINDVLDLSKIEAGRLEIDQGPADLHRLLQGVQDVVRQRAESKGLEFSLDVSPEVPRGIITDTTKLKQVLVNLIGNSVKFTERGDVALRVAESRDKRLAFSVEDTGIGMTPQESQDIFDPFKQAEGGKTSGGTGLGLAISQRIVAALGGALDVKSKKGEGSCFSFSLPLSEVDDIDVAVFREESLTDTHHAVLAPGQDVTALIADDGDTNRDILKHLLTAAGFKTVEAENGKEAIDKLRQHQMTLVLMDVRMPVMNGIDATQEIRRDAKLKDTVIIAVTASVFPEFKTRAMEVGFDDFIAKPYRAAEVFAKIEQHLKVKFVDEAQEDLSVEDEAEAASLAPELARDIAARLRNAAELGNLSELNALASELMERDDTASSYGRKISQLTKTFDFSGVITLANSLEQPVAGDAA